MSFQAGFPTRTSLEATETWVPSQKLAIKRRIHCRMRGKRRLFKTIAIETTLASLRGRKGVVAGVVDSLN